jgi:hypothetical protein
LILFSLRDKFYIDIIFSDLISHRLIGGEGNFEGVLDFNYNGDWGVFCRDGYFTDNDATVVCKMRGFQTG